MKKVATLFFAIMLASASLNAACVVKAGCASDNIVTGVVKAVGAVAVGAVKLVGCTAATAGKVVAGTVHAVTHPTTCHCVKCCGR